VITDAILLVRAKRCHYLRLAHWVDLARRMLLNQ
jgi:hypothetical protein